ncbi:MAG: acyl-CoA dehydrogenase family protein [Acidimicrobiales bacterium]
MDLRPSDDETAIDEVFAAFFTNECPIEAVRAAEPLGFDPAAWERLAQTGAPGMCVDEAAGGGGADLATAAIVATRLGASLAPVPLLEHLVATRLIASVAPDHGALAGLVEGSAIATLALRPARNGVARLAPAGAVAHVVVALDGDELVVVQNDPPGSGPRTTADLPLADRSLADGRTVVATGTDAVDAHRAAATEWQALMASALVGLGARAIEIGVEYAKERYQFGVPVGSFQGVQHGLATAVTGIDGARFLASRAVWALDTGQADGARLAPMAFLFAAETALAAAAASLQYHGGYGFAEEYDIQLYYRRAKGWPLQYGEPALEYQRLAAMTLPAARTSTDAGPVAATV